MFVWLAGWLYSSFPIQRSNSDNIPAHGPFLRGPTARLKKLSNFFGEEPPYLEDLQSFLDGLGYSYLLPVLRIIDVLPKCVYSHRLSVTTMKCVVASLALEGRFPTLTSGNEEPQASVFTDEGV